MSTAILKCVLCQGTGVVDGARCVKHVFEAMPAHIGGFRLVTRAGQVVGQLTCDWPESIVWAGPK